MAIALTVNGKAVSVEAQADTPLLWVVREHLKLTGTKYGCGAGLCGACTVHVDGSAVRSCQTPVSAAAGKTVTTIEGLAATVPSAAPDQLHPVQEAFLAENAFQCGFCTAGMIIAATALLNAKPHPTDAEIVAGMNKNLCRCCSYVAIANAVRRAAQVAQPTGGEAHVK